MGTAAQPTRENRTITVDFRSEATYFQLLGNGKAFLDCRMVKQFKTVFTMKVTTLVRRQNQQSAQRVAPSDLREDRLKWALGGFRASRHCRGSAQIDEDVTLPCL